MLQYSEFVMTPSGWRRVSVKLDGRVVGDIREERDGYRYFPRRSKDGGLLFPTLSACKRSLENGGE
jgi:hypothetical protein